MSKVTMKLRNISKEEGSLPTVNMLYENMALMDSKITALSKEVNDLKLHNNLLMNELTMLANAQKVEEHKGEKIDKLPPYEQPSIEEMELIGIDTINDMSCHT